MRPILYIVEDDLPALASVVIALGHRSSRLRLLGASNHPASALVAVECEHVDLLVTDCNLPDMDGIELTQRVKQISPVTRVLLITGYYDPTITRRALAAGTDGVLHKPFELPALRHCVHTVLAGHRVLSDRATGHLLTTPLAEDPGITAAKQAMASLSPKQRKVMTLLISDHCLKEVADQLGMSFHTADTHRRRAYRALGVHSLADAIRKLTGAQLGS